LRKTDSSILNSTVSENEKQIVLHLRNAQEVNYPEISNQPIIENVENLTPDSTFNSRFEEICSLRRQYYSQNRSGVESSAITEAPALFIPEPNLSQSNIEQIVSTRVPELCNFSILVDNDLEESSVSEGDCRNYMINLPDINDALASETAEILFSSAVSSILPLPPITGFIPYNSFINQTNTVTNSVTADMTTYIFGDLPRDSSFIRLRQLREAVVEVAINSGVYRPGDVLPQTSRVTVYHFILTRLFSLFRPETLANILDFLTQSFSPVSQNSNALGVIATILVFLLIKPLFLSCMPPSFWLLSFDRIRSFFITSLEHTIYIFSLGSERILSELRRLYIGSELYSLNYANRNLVRLLLETQSLLGSSNISTRIELFGGNLVNLHNELFQSQRDSNTRDRVFSFRMNVGLSISVGIMGIVIYHQFDSIVLIYNSYLNSVAIGFVKTRLIAILAEAGYNVGPNTDINYMVECLLKLLGGATISGMSAFILQGVRILLKAIFKRR